MARFYCRRSTQPSPGLKMHTRAHLIVVVLVFMLVDKVVDVLTQLWVVVEGGREGQRGHGWGCGTHYHCPTHRVPVNNC